MWRLVRPRTGHAERSRAASSTVANEEPLKRELVDFVDAIRDRPRPGVTGDDGRRALQLGTADHRADDDSGGRDAMDSAAAGPEQSSNEFRWYWTTSQPGRGRTARSPTPTRRRCVHLRHRLARHGRRRRAPRAPRHADDVPARRARAGRSWPASRAACRRPPRGADGAPFVDIDARACGRAPARRLRLVRSRVSGFSLADIEQAAAGDIARARAWFDALRDAGCDDRRSAGRRAPGARGVLRGGRGRRRAGRARDRAPRRA